MHKFKSLSGYSYIYDVRTNKIVQVDGIIFDIIDDFGNLSFPEIISKYKFRHRVDKLRKALRELEVSHKKGIFSNKRFTKMNVPYDAEYLAREVASNAGYMVLNITEACNMRCKYCVFSGSYKYARFHSNNSMTSLTLQKALQYYQSHSKTSQVKSISFYGGEPLLEFYRIINAKNMINNDEYNFKINSNGLLLENRAITDALTDNNIGLQVSIDGPAKIHDRYRVDVNGKPSFTRIFNNLRYIKQRNPKYYKKSVNFQATFAIDSDLGALADFFEREELVNSNSCAITFVKSSDTTFYKRFTEDDFTRHCRQYEDLTGNYMRRRIAGQEPSKLGKMLFDKSLSLFHLRTLNEPYDTIGLNGCCIPGLRKFFVNTDGKLYPCERVMTAYNIGDVDAGLEMDKILAVAHNYKNNSEADCINCWGAKICGVCFLHAEKNSDFNMDRKREKCARMLETKHEELVIYSTIMEKNPRAFDFTKNMKFA